MTYKKICYALDEVDAVVSALREEVGCGVIVTLTGLLGAGKTTFVQKLCASFGVTEPVVSPTYAYMAAYELEGFVIYHFDLYRISGIEEFESFGFSEYLNNPYGIVLIEWPDRIASLLARPPYKEKTLALSFKYVPKKPELREICWNEPSNSLGSDQEEFRN